MAPVAEKLPLTPAERLARARAEEAAANQVAADDAAAVTAARNALAGDDMLVALKAEADLPKLRLKAAESAVAKEVARQARLAAEPPVREDRAAHYRPLVVAINRRLDAAMETARAISLEQQRLIAAARSDDGRDATDGSMVLSDFFGDVDRPNGDSRLASWRRTMAKHGWL
jgi:hypothetical protein